MNIKYKAEFKIINEWITSLKMTPSLMLKFFYLHNTPCLGRPVPIVKQSLPNSINIFITFNFQYFVKTIEMGNTYRLNNKSMETPQYFHVLFRSLEKSFGYQRFNKQMYAQPSRACREHASIEKNNLSATSVVC